MKISLLLKVITKPVYESMKYLSDELNGGTKSLIGFVGAPWTILVYMLNKQSPKKTSLMK